jgi:hypothetical protein
MKFLTTTLLASLSNLSLGAVLEPPPEARAAASTPYFCRNYTGITYEEGIKIQADIVALFAPYEPNGLVLNASNSVITTSGALEGIVQTDGATVTVTSEMVQSGFGQLLSGCVSIGYSGYLLISDVWYVII